MEYHGAIHRGDTHAVAIIAHTGNDAMEDFLGVQNARGKITGRKIKRAEAENIGVANRPGAEPSAHGVADDSAYASAGTAIGFNGAGAVMGFHLENQVLVGMEANHPGVVFKDRNTPVIFAQVFAYLDRGLKNGLFQEIPEGAPGCLHPALQGFVGAMLAPSLGNGLQLDVRDVAAQAADMLLDAPHLGR